METLCVFLMVIIRKSWRRKCVILNPAEIAPPVLREQRGAEAHEYIDWQQRAD